MNQPLQAIELVLFSGKPGVTAEQMHAAAQAMAPRVEQLPGYVSRSFGVGTDGGYVDVLHWRDMAAAQHAAKTVMSCPVCLAFFELIEPSSIRMMHFERP